MNPPSVSPSSELARFAALYEVSRLLGQSLDLAEALATVMEAAIRLTHAERGFLMLIDPDTRALEYRLGFTVQRERIAETAFEVSRTVVQQVLDTAAPVITSNAQLDTRFAAHESVTQYALRSIMAVPLVARGQPIGVLYVDHKIQAGLFAAADLELLTLFAAQAAVAIDNARLHTQTDAELAARVADLQTMQQIDQELNAALDSDKVLNVTLRWAVQQTRADSGWIGLVQDDGVRVAAGTGLGQVLPLDHAWVRSALKPGVIQPVAPVPGVDEPPLVRRIAPVRRNERVIALIAVERPTPFAAAGVEFLARLAEHAAIAIENARLYEAVRNANQAKTKFVSVVTHELRLPMTSIKGYTDLLRTGMVGPVNDQQQQFLNVIRNNVERMSVLVSDLSDISRMETGRLQLTLGRVNLVDALNDAAAAVKTQLDGKQQTLVLHYPAELPTVWADKNRIQQILLNLISNAHKYSPAGTTIEVTAEPTETQIRVQVRDEGFGIAPADQARLFSQFFRSEESNIREQPGWGLGLHVTKGLVEVLGGEISAASQLGAGSTFVFTLPRDPA